MTDTELEQLVQSLPSKTPEEIGALASDAFVGYGFRDDGDTAVVLHGIVVYLLRELAALRESETLLRDGIRAYEQGILDRADDMFKQRKEIESLERELLPLRKLREAVDMEIMPVQAIAAILCSLHPDAAKLVGWIDRLQLALAACDEATAPTGDER